MAQRPSLRLKTTQRLGLGAQIRMGLRFLALPSVDLDQELALLAAENPLLTYQPPLAPPVAAPQGRTAFEIASDTVSETLSLGAHLRAQLGEMDLAADVARAARAITWSLDDRGFLDADLDEIMQASETGRDAALRGLAAVQSCTPTGVGARDLADCLALQLAAQGIAPDAARAAIAVLTSIAAAAWTKAAAESGLSADMLRRIGKLLPSLSAVPAAAFGAAATPVRPDLVLDFDTDGRPLLRQAQASMHRLGLDSGLRRTLRAQAETPEALRTYVTQSIEVIRAVQFRNATLLRVAEHCVTHQMAYLSPQTGGVMRPLSRKDVAAALALHPSTVGRAIAGKYLGWRGRTLPLSTLFPTQIGDAGHSAHTAQMRLAELVAGEDPAQVLSDEDLADRLKSEGVDIARRTVAKYRGCLGIAPSHMRKRIKRKHREDGLAARNSAD